MKLQTKLFIGLMTGLLTVYLGSCLFQRYSNLTFIDRFSQQCKTTELERHWGWVECVQQAVTTSLEKVMAMGDMDLFEKIMHEQASLPGLQEAFLTDYKGRIAYSTLAGKPQGRGLPEELKSQLLSNPARFKRQTTNSFEIYQPLIADQSCISCHTERRQGEVLGVLSLSFSAQALRTAEQTWTVFHDDFSRTNTLVTAITTVVLLVIIGILIGLCVHYLLVVPLNRTAGDLFSQAQEVTAAAGQVSASSQSLAEGASQQASSLEETSASLTELSAMTKGNAEHAFNATNLAQKTRLAAEKGAGHMTELAQAIEDIKASGGDIAKIIKDINEIAFQTNILALNAAVEAARAGEAGMGFAVVADEVRALAQRSAKAARETEERIEGSLSRTKKGSELSERVSQAFGEIITNAKGTDELDADVATASREQESGIKQISTAVEQMDKVTQANAANSEECAASAEELNAQAELMKEAVNELILLVGGRQQSFQRPATSRPPGKAPKRPNPSPAPPRQEKAPTAGAFEQF